MIESQIELYISILFLFKFKNLEAYISLNIDIFLHIFVKMKLQVRLTFGQTLGQVDIWSDVPPEEVIPVKFSTTIFEVH